MRHFMVLLLFSLNAVEARVHQQSEDLHQPGSTKSLYDCRSSRLPTVPAGLTTTYDAQFGDDHARFTIWRMACQDGRNLPVITIEPISYKPFVCTFNFKIFQEAYEYDNVLLIKNPHNKWSFICGDIKHTTTVFIDQLESPYFDSDEGFTLIHKRPNHVAIDTEVAPLGGPGDLEISGRLSGTYHQSDNDESEFIILVTEQNNVRGITVYWLSFLNGYPYLLKGYADVLPGQAEINLPLYTYNGSSETSNSEDAHLLRGVIKLNWLSCDQLMVDYESLMEIDTKSFMLDKISADIHGLDCY